MEVWIGNGEYKTAVFISARRERPNLIVSADFLAAHNCDLSIHQKLFTIGNDKYSVYPRVSELTTPSSRFLGGFSYTINQSVG